MNHQTSRRAVVRTPSGPGSIEIIDAPVPEPGPGQVRVKVAAAAINPVDLDVVSGRLHGLGLVSQAEHTGLGADFSGVVEAAGDGVGLALGTRVAGFVGGVDRDHGSHAEHLVVAADDVAGLPDGMCPNVAASMPLTLTTAAQLLGVLGDVPPQARRLLVTGAAGGVGAAVAVLAKERGWQVTGLARAGDQAFVHGLGVGFTTAPAGGWDVVADAAAMQEEALSLVRDGGTFVGVLPGLEPDEERGVTVGVVVSRPDGPLLARLLDRVVDGTVPARIHAALPLTEVVSAYRLLAKGGVRGRVVVLP
ncbi:zinc-binding dehydrogenase [Isoptericola sp. NEAU-Y5]|uniref:Zinc-binding dehydrogenase n=1 Tax=Isoptericola luteus TaxID=2879484 RepID=A0ABS7ZB88_9MICO|nr:zinc-binding dehydrogenase [Isoptericola sp. NEAU-Y5]MCA5892275.1 zinc-binding dehydrogenase [Isoptericola sp. NEAU-Y5]